MLSLLTTVSVEAWDVIASFLPDKDFLSLRVTCRFLSTLRKTPMREKTLECLWTQGCDVSLNCGHEECLTYTSIHHKTFNTITITTLFLRNVNEMDFRILRNTFLNNPRLFNNMDSYAMMRIAMGKEDVEFITLMHSSVFRLLGNELFGECDPYDRRILMLEIRNLGTKFRNMGVKFNIAELVMVYPKSKYQPVSRIEWL